MRGLFQNIQLSFAYLFKVINNKKNIYYFGYYKFEIVDNNKIQHNIFGFFFIIKN